MKTRVKSRRNYTTTTDLLNAHATSLKIPVMDANNTEAYDKAFSLYQEMYKWSSKTIELDRHNDALLHAVIASEEVIDVLTHPTDGRQMPPCRFWIKVRKELIKMQ